MKKAKQLLHNARSCWLAVVMLTLVPASAYALDFKEIVKKTGELLKGVAYALGPGLGLLFALQGLMKIRRKEDDPREFSRGITFIVVGVLCAIIGLLVASILNYYGQNVSNTGNIDISNPW